MIHIVIILLSFLIGETTHVTGEKVATQEITSFGNYIYGWPSKYDLVFWPLTYENWICLNSKNGYAAFNNHFLEISGKQKRTLKIWLAKNYNSTRVPKTHKEKLVWLEKVNNQRKMDDTFWCLFYRLMAYVHRDDQEKSLGYVNRAMPLLKKKLETKPLGIEKIEVLFLLGEYYRRIGEIERAKEHFDQVKETKYKDKKGKEQVGHPYFISLIQDRENQNTEESFNK